MRSPRRRARSPRNGKASRRRDPSGLEPSPGPLIAVAAPLRHHGATRSEAPRMLDLADDLVLNRQHISFELDGGIAARAALGLVVLATDHTIEHEWRRILGPLEGVSFYEARLHNAAEITPEK